MAVLVMQMSLCAYFPHRTLVFSPCDVEGGGLWVAREGAACSVGGRDHTLAHCKDAGLPSKGSALHSSGRCKPCLYYLNRKDHPPRFSDVAVWGQTSVGQRRDIRSQCGEGWGFVGRRPSICCGFVSVFLPATIPVVLSDRFGISVAS